MQRRTLSALAAPLLVLGAAGCGDGGGTSTAEVKAEIATQMGESGFADAQAECFADVVVDELGVDTVKDLDFASDEPPPGKEDEFAAAAVKALADCDIDLASLSG